MSGSDSQGSEQFSLVSLKKTEAKQAAQSYGSMSRRASGEPDSTLDVNENEAKEKLAPPPPPKKKTVSEKAPPKKQKKRASLDEGVDQSIDDILDKFKEFSDSLQVLFGNITQVSKGIAVVVMTPLIPFLNRILKLLNVPLQFINVLTRKINEKMRAKSGQDPVSPVEPVDAAEQQEEEPQEEHSVDAQSASFSDMIELNIAFTDNMKKPLYKKPSGMATKLGAMEEDLIMSNALLAINECAEFTLDLPAPTTGIYAGQKIYDIMSNVSKEDVAIFLGFVKAFPGKYIGKEWKVSETFATWLINNAPVAGE